MHIVIIGGSINAITAAAHMRRENEKIRITIIDKSSTMSSAICGIPDFLQGKISDTNDLLSASPKLLHQVFNINLLLNIDVLHINHDIKLIHLSNGKKLSYDKLIFANPPLHLRPDIPGILSDNIFTLHSVAAAQRVNDYFWGMQAKNIIILGGSRLGIQTAVAYANHHAKVTIIEQSSQLLSYIDPEFSAQISKILQKNSVEVITSTNVNTFYSDIALLSNGLKIKYDMAIITTGSHNEVRIPIKTGIKLGITGGIIVNENMQTNLKDIFACGETIELKNSLSGLPFRIRNASLAAQTAKIVADNVLGNTTHIPLIFNNEIIEVFNYRMGVCGCTEKELQNAEIPYQTVWLNTNLEENYITPLTNIKMKIIFDNSGKILGFQAFGTKGVFPRLNTIAALMQIKGNIRNLCATYLSYNPAMSRTKDSINILGSLALAIQSGDIKTINISDLRKGDILLNLGSKLPANHHAPYDIIDIPFIKLRMQIPLLPHNQIIALFCRNGYSSYMAYCLLKAKGFSNIFLLNSPFLW